MSWKFGRIGSLEWLPSVLAALAFLLLLAVFVVNLNQFTGAVDGWARRDLEARTELAARTLDESLRTQNIRELHQFGDSCRGIGVHLCVKTSGGGVFYDTRTTEERKMEYLTASSRSGEYQVALMIPWSRVKEPFYKALPEFVLAAMLGVAGMFFFFLVTYRQRVRIRELKKLEKFRRDFIADVSHEIKTPLTGILGAVDMLGVDGVQSLDRDMECRLLGMIRNESKRLNGLVQSILDLARLEREGDILRVEEVDLAALVRDVAGRYPCKCESEGECVVWCDPQLISQAISNLITNAVKHSGSDDITVALECNSRQVGVSVEDHGIGVPPEHAERIFERFHRVDPARAAETGGAGLGLAIVRRIARLHGGDVTLSAAVPHGARFTLTITRGS